jgi:C-terminal processing protease CtpA/Prc
MLKQIAVVALAVASGVGIAMYLRSDPASQVPDPAFTPRAGATDAERLADLEKALAAQVDRANLLEGRLAELEARPGNRRDAENTEARTERMAETRRQFEDANGNFDPTKMREQQRERQLDRLVRAGFTRERAEWIERRTQELQVQAMQAQYEAQRSGQQFRGVDMQAALRKEIGDGEYEKYLTATNRPTRVQVMDVLASSVAERSGLQAGDQIVSYAGTRVFDMSELNALTRQGTAGESVTVEVQRNGQVVQVQVPRGVLGVEGGGGRGGPPGGFRNGGFGGGPGGGRPPGGGG